MHHTLTPLSDLPFLLGSRATTQIGVDTQVNEEYLRQIEREKTLGNNVKRRLFPNAVQGILGSEKMEEELFESLAPAILDEDWIRVNGIFHELKKFEPTPKIPKKTKGFLAFKEKYQKHLDAASQEKMKITVASDCSFDEVEKLHQRLLSIGANENAISAGILEGKEIFERLPIKTNTKDVRSMRLKDIEILKRLQYQPHN